jgi:hypothetical protein
MAFQVVAAAATCANQATNLIGTLSDIGPRCSLSARKIEKQTLWVFIPDTQFWNGGAVFASSRRRKQAARDRGDVSAAARSSGATKVRLY